MPEEGAPGSELTHLDPSGRARMVDVSEKPETRRVAVAAGEVRMQPSTIALLRSRRIAKGDALAVARIAGIGGGKLTSHLIPLCHPLPIYDLNVEIELQDDRALLEASIVTVARTGAEMEALTAVTTAALALYDMCKAVDREICISNVRLVFKSGGKTPFREPGYRLLYSSGEPGEASGE